MAKPSEYKMIERWGVMLGSRSYYIDQQQAIAASENAPLNATFRRSNGKWATTDEITEPETRRVMRLDEVKT